jgi:hypothetical protein
MPSDLQTRGNRKMAKFEKGNNHGNRFQKGVSGNPLGKTKSALLTDAVRSQLAENNDVGAIAEALIGKAKRGDLEAVKILFDRLEGKAVSRIDAEVNVFSWKAAIVNYGITPEEILTEAKRLLADEFENDYNESIS